MVRSVGGCWGVGWTEDNKGSGQVKCTFCDQMSINVLCDKIQHFPLTDCKETGCIFL